MRLNPLISALICFLGACVAQATGGGIPDSKSLPPYAPYVQCVKEEADIILEAVVRIDGVFGDSKRQFFFRRSKDGSDSVMFASSSTNSDGVSKSGKGVGHGLSLFPTPTKSGLELQLRAYWTIDAGRGESEIALLVPYFSDESGSLGGFTYSVKWRKAK